MKNISRIAFAALFVLSSATLLHAQTTGSQGGYMNTGTSSYPSTSTYTNPSTYPNTSTYPTNTSTYPINTSTNPNATSYSSTPTYPNTSAYSNSTSTYPNVPSYTNSSDSAQTGMMNSNTTTQWGTQNSDRFGNQTPGTTQGQMTNPNRPYTQPSNISKPGSLSMGDSPTTTNTTWTDEGIAQKIRWTIRSDKTLSPIAKSTEVTVKNFNVTLSGSVNSPDEKSRIATIARQTDGVKSVSNNITVTGK